MIWKTNSLLSNQQKSTENLAYWQDRLNTAPPCLTMPSDFSRNLNCPKDLATNSIFSKLDLMVSDQLWQKLQSVAQEKNIDLELIFLSAYYVLLYRYTNQPNISIGYCSLDNSDSVNNLVLPFIFKIDNTQSSFLDLLNYSGDRFLALKQHQNISVEHLEENTLPWYQMLFSYDNQAPQLPAKLSNQRELCLSINPQSSQISLEFNTGLFLAETCHRIINNYHRLLEDIAEYPHKQIDRLSLLTETETDLLLNQWNQTQVEPESRCVHQLFETRVEQNAHAIALKCQDRQLTYSELNQKANQLAHYLQTLGVGKNSLVGLCLERSLDMVVGVLGILKTGAAYVPLDQENPAARLSYILEDSQIAVLLTESALQGQVPQSDNLSSIVYLDRDWNAIEQQPTDNLNIHLNREDLAHIVYTSGSTGKPKGVMITHGNLSHYAHSLQIALDITPDDVYLHRGSIALIVSARQLLMPLAQGATVSILTTADKKDPLKMFESIKDHGVTIVDRVPSFWRNFSGILDSLSIKRRQSLMDNRVRLVAAGGEQVSLEIYQCWRKLFKPEVKLANIYGQTEGTGVVTIYYIPEEIDRHFKSLPVGSPIPNMKVYVLDKELQPVPIGVT